MPHAWFVSGRFHVARFLALGVVLSFAAATQAADAKKPSLPPPLHEQIDRLLEADVLAPPSPAADDAEFLRRVTLDLHGIIPTADEARAFLDGRSTDKRAKLIDALLASPRFARHMATVLDVMWMERRTQSPEWYDYLYRSLLDGKPYDRIVREVLLADDQKPELKPAAKFFEARACEPNTMTRDIGRFFFGMDMQCNQCHDHPVVDDYTIGDYYGLYAFVSRTYLHQDKKSKEKLVAEKADGEASFKSVFTGESADKVQPRLPRGAVLVEPVVKKGEEYLVKPDKGARPVPKFSRRQELAALTTDGKNELFNRNAANRLWAHLFGRGLVQPVDFIHPDNPPTHPEVLELLAREFHDRKYDIRSLLGELLLTRAYQRSFVLPGPEALKPGIAAKRLATWEADVKSLAAAYEKVEGKNPAEARHLQTRLHAAKQHIEEAKQVIEYERLAKSDKKAAARAWDALVQRWTDRGDVAILKPLSPEVFAASLLQAAGLVETAEAKAEAALKKSLPKEIAAAKPNERPKMEAVWLDRQTFEPLKGNYSRFVDLYGEAPGADFAATINQALFFGNGGVVEGWLKPSGNNLAARLDKLKDPAAVADEMYLAVLTRRPTAAERNDVASYLKGREKDRSAAVQELLWAFTASNEFRFNH